MIMHYMMKYRKKNQVKRGTWATGKKNDNRHLPSFKLHIKTCPSQIKAAQWDGRWCTGGASDLVPLHLVLPPIV